MQRVRQANDRRIDCRVLKQVVIIGKNFCWIVGLLEFRTSRFIDIGTGVYIRILQRLRGNSVLLAGPAGADDAEIIFLQRSTLPRCFFTWLRLRFVSKILSFSARGLGRLRRRNFSR